MEPKNTLTIDDYEELVNMMEKVQSVYIDQALVDAYDHLLVLWGYKKTTDNKTDRARLHEIRNNLKETIRKLEKDTPKVISQLKTMQKKLSPAPKRKK